MQMDEEIEKIIIKYFTKSASVDDISRLADWVEKESNDSVLLDYIRINYLINHNVIDFDTEGEKDRILERIKKDEKNIRVQKIRRMFQYAAVIVVVLGLGFLFNLEHLSVQKEDNKITDVQPVIEPGKDKAILKLEDGSEVVLEKGKKLSLNGRTLSGEKLTYNKSKSGKKHLKYNYLTIPRGGQFFVELSDGTKVWLNSDTQLKYPVSFIEGQPRKVELVYGEVYFDVSESTNHNGDSFIVRTGVQEIEVLGTEFNLRAYDDESDIVTTLVEGKIVVDVGQENRMLSPSEQAIINNTGGEINVRKVDKLFDEIAWKEGYFSFKRKSMKEIMKILSRWYDVEYVFKDSKIESKSFTGVLDRETSIDQILIYIQKTNEIDFKIDQKTIILE